MSEETRIIEVNGVKLEVDLRTAKRIDTLRVGNQVKVLIKGYSDSYSVHAGVVIGFEPFEALPTIVIAYLDKSYDPGIKMLYYNEKSEGSEVIPALEEALTLAKGDVLEKFDREIIKRQQEIDDYQRKREYFLRHFGAYFSETNEPNDQSE